MLIITGVVGLLLFCWLLLLLAAGSRDDDAGRG
jgi:hypothetical protein